MVIALVLSGGTGSRLGADIPKQYLRVQGRPVLLYCMETLHKSPVIDAVQIVAAQEWQEEIGSWLEVYGLAGKFRGFSLPGENRQLSIFHGLTDIRQNAEEDDLILIHDAARPLLSQKLIADCAEAIRGHDGVLPVLPMKDTVYYSKDGRQITSLLDRQADFSGWGLIIRQMRDCFRRRSCGSMALRSRRFWRECRSPWFRGMRGILRSRHRRIWNGSGRSWRMRRRR